MSAAALAAYSVEARAGYALLQKKCTVCHAASRPLNSQFVESAGDDAAARDKALAELRARDPSLFADERVWQIEAGIWQRYVKRMMAKPGCEVGKDEGKLIWAFLAHDSRARKLGAAKESWRAQRLSLLKKFEAEHPARYKQLYSSK